VVTGGQNPIEPVMLDTAVLHGPHVHNFAEIYGHLDRAVAPPPIADAATLATAVSALLASPRAAAERARAATAALRPLAGALEATLRGLEPLLAAGAAPS